MSDWEAVARAVVPGATLEAHRPLHGGVSAQVSALSLRTASGPRTVVVKQPPVAGWKHGEDDPSQAEHDLLRTLFEAGFPVPEPLHLDRSGRLLPGPWLALAFVEGTTRVPPEGLDVAVDRIAALMVRLHGLAPETLVLPELPERTDPLPGVLEWLPQELEAAREQVRRVEAPVGGGRCLLHGDVWPENLIWREGAIAALVDWEDAALGDPVSDVAVTRQELCWRFGEAAAERFVGAYTRTSGRSLEALPLWQLYVGSAALRWMGNWGLPPEVEAHNRRVTLALLQRSAAQLRC